MSRQADELYFAPNVLFRGLDVKTGRALPSQLRERILGFYLEPALTLVKSSPFGAGVLVVCAMDALCLFMTGSSGNRIIGLCRMIPDLASNENAEDFCECFRNGLVHQALVKKGCEFDSDIDTVAVRRGKRLIVNPKKLAEEVVRVLRDHVDFLNKTPHAKAALVRRMRRTFRYELA
jgi:hypothetical protein